MFILKHAKHLNILFIFIIFSTIKTTSLYSGEQEVQTNENSLSEQISECASCFSETSKTAYQRKDSTEAIGLKNLSLEENHGIKSSSLDFEITFCNPSGCSKTISSDFNEPDQINASAKREFSREEMEMEKITNYNLIKGILKKCYEVAEDKSDIKTLSRAVYEYGLKIEAEAYETTVQKIKDEIIESDKDFVLKMIQEYIPLFFEEVKQENKIV